MPIIMTTRGIFVTALVERLGAGPNPLCHFIAPRSGAR